MPCAPLAPALYDAVVTHARRERIRRTFTHRIYLWLVDLDALPRLPGWWTPFARFEARDHLGDPRRSIRDNLDRWLKDQGVDLHGGRVLMLTNARTLGYVFNPITIYWCHQPDGTLECVVTEVHNTYGGRHCYLLRLDPHHRGQADKRFYVSPFLAVDGTYLMRVADPGPTLSVSIVLRREQRTALAVRLRGVRRAATASHVLRMLLRQPLGSYRTAALIRLHGIALWLRGLPIVPRPPHTAHRTEGCPMKTMAGDQAPTSRHDDPVLGRPAVTNRDPVHCGPPSARRATVPAALARLVLRAGVRSLPVRVRLPGGRSWGGGGLDTPVMYLARPAEFFQRVGADANIGLGEAYQAGDWHSPDLADLLTVFANRLATVVPPWAQALRLRIQGVRHHPQANTIATSRRNAAAHYDLSNEMFAAFLDETMTYSAAMFTPGDTDLTRAQLRKIDTMLDDAAVRAGSEVLEIGTGWGALAVRAAQRGATVTTLTLSAEQARLAHRRAAEAGVADRVRILVQDYRQAQGQYDAVISVEMIEAVGAEHWPTFFTTLDQLVKPGGRVALQAITMPHRRMRVSQQSKTWINKYFFPGGLIPSVRAIEDNLSEHTTLRVAQRRDLGNDYATTLRSWRERLFANWPAIEQAGFDATFRRGWEYYLAYCEAGFRAGYLGLSQFRLTQVEARADGLET